ncbi:MAG: TonB-dependent receptor plug domain-containing protein, partial [Gemmatimonadaceae bacterium]
MNVSVGTYFRRAIATAIAVAGVAGVAAAQGQSATITGQVVSETGTALEGANVFITELNISVGTNAAGRYNIIVPAARVANQSVQLRVRQIGFVPQARPVTITPGTQTVDFNLKVDVNRLSAVVTLGVSGATEQTKVPFAVSTVDAADMPVPATNPLSQLQGKVAGVNIKAATGRPGANPAILLRAPTSIDASGRGQNPLIIVDGVITNGDLSSIAAEDIQSIEVVKGAAGASLYGARAANGVIQIRTKTGGTSEGTTFNVRTEYGVSNIEHEITLAQNHIWLMSPDGSRFCANRACTTTFDYMEQVTKLNNSASTVPSLTGVMTPVQQTTSPWTTFQNGVWPGRTYNQIDQVVEPGPFSQSNFDIQGRVGGTSFFTSYNNVRQEGSIIGLSGYTRNGFRVNLDHDFADKLTMAVRSYYSRANSDGQDVEGAALFDLTRMPAGVDLLSRDTLRNQYIIRPDLSAENENPVYDLSYRDREDVVDRILGGATLTYKPFSFLDVEGNMSYDRASTEQKRFVDKGFRTSRGVSSLNNGNITNGTSDNASTNGSVQATLRHAFASDLQTRWQARALYERQDVEQHNFQGWNLAVAGTEGAGNIAQNSISLGNLDQSVRQMSYIGLANAEWKERYIVDGLVRRDGSSLFGAGNRWATFGRGSVAWRVAQEPWFAVPGVDEFKLRYSIGQAGNTPRFNAQYETYTLGGGLITRNTIGNKDLRPEISTEQELGGDFEFFNRVGLNLTYSTATVKDQLLLVPLSSTTGYVSQW